MWDVLRLVDLLVGRPDVDATRIGIAGGRVSVMVEVMMLMVGVVALVS